MVFFRIWSHSHLGPNKMEYAFLLLLILFHIFLPHSSGNLSPPSLTPFHNFQYLLLIFYDRTSFRYLIAMIRYYCVKLKQDFIISFLNHSSYIYVVASVIVFMIREFLRFFKTQLGFMNMCLKLIFGDLKSRFLNWCCNVHLFRSF